MGWRSLGVLVWSLPVQAQAPDTPFAVVAATTDAVRIFVDERPVTVAPGTALGDAVAAQAPELAAALREGRAHLTDGVGRPIDPATPAFPGAIVRVIRSARRGPA